MDVWACAQQCCTTCGNAFFINGCRKLNKSHRLDVWATGETPAPLGGTGAAWMVCISNDRDFKLWGRRWRRSICLADDHATRAQGAAHDGFWDKNA